MPSQDRCRRRDRCFTAATRGVGPLLVLAALIMFVIASHRPAANSVTSSRFA
jgi:hypothetical protein